MIAMDEVKVTTKAPRKFIPMRLKTNLVEITLEGGGRIPAVLKGSFTSVTMANQAIDVYLKGKMNGTSRNKSSET